MVRPNKTYLLSEVFGEGIGGSDVSGQRPEKSKIRQGLLEKVSGSGAMDFEGKILGRLIIPEGGMSRS